MKESADFESLAQIFDPPDRSAQPLEEAEDVCPDCHGRGWKVVADGGAGTAVRCDCLKKRRGNLYLSQSGIPELYRRCRLANFRTTGSVKVRQLLLAAHKACDRYVDTFIDPQTGRFRETGLIFVGPPGIGKTHLAAAVLIELIERYNVRGKFIDFTTLLHKIRSTFDPGSVKSKTAILDPIIKAEVLVLDELGAQKPTDWVMDTLYLIMNSRYTSRRPTIFTTNYSLDGKKAASKAGDDERYDPSSLSSRIASPLVSRLYEMAKVVNLSVDFDYRREVRQVHVSGR